MSLNNNGSFCFYSVERYVNKWLGVLESLSSINILSFSCTVWKWVHPWGRGWVSTDVCFPSHPEESGEGNHPECLVDRPDPTHDGVSLNFLYCIFVKSDSKPLLSSAYLTI